jgi:hypothetical protein
MLGSAFPRLLKAPKDFRNLRRLLKTAEHNSIGNSIGNTICNTIEKQMLKQWMNNVK